MNACGASAAAAWALPPATSSSRSAWAAGSGSARGALLRRASASSGRRRGFPPAAPRAGVSGAELPPRKIAMALALQEAGAWEEMPLTRRPEGGQLEQRPRPQEDTWTLEDASGYTGLGRDENKDAERRYMRSLSTFTFERWEFHRSTSRYQRHMTGIFQSRIVRGLAQPLLSAGATATAVCLYEALLQEGTLPDYLPSLLMPSLPFDITSFALSLLLVFRTNTSYDRWHQAVTAWADISTRSRDTMRQLLSYTSASRRASAGSGGSPSSGGGGGGSSTSGTSQDAVLSATATCRWLVAFARSLKAQLTQDSDLEAELQGVLTAQELRLLVASYHRPSFALAVLSELAAEAPVNEVQRIRLDENLTYFQQCVGECERLLRTPIPLSYTRHTSRFMVIWLSCLPLGLWRYCGWGTIPLTVVISFLLLGIEEIGVLIEEPFGLMPLGNLCSEIEVGLSSILAQAAGSKEAAREAAAAASAAVAAGAGSPVAAMAATAVAAAPAAAAAAAAGGAVPGTSNAVAPFMQGSAGLRGAGASREAVPAHLAGLSPEAIFQSMDESEI